VTKQSIALDEASVLRRLDDSESVRALVKRLKIADKTARQLRANLARLPACWDAVQMETASEIMAGRRKLAAAMRTLARRLDEDSDFIFLSMATIRDGALSENWISECMSNDSIWNKPRLSAFLRQLADDEVDKHPLGRCATAIDTRRRSLKSFIVRDVTTCVTEAYGIKGRGANQLIAAFSAALIGAPVSNNDVTQANKSRRRRYCRE
jgi:hypothetical protein